MPQDNDNTLDTNAMSQKLKGDSFPEDAFLNSDVKLFFDELFAQTELSKSDIIREANLPRTYGYQIFDGTRAAQRDYYLRIALAMKLDLRTTQRLLAVAKAGALHSLIKRDAAIIFAINHGYDNIDIHDFLTGMDLAPLDKENDESADD